MMRLKNELDQASRMFVTAMEKRGWSAHTVRAYERGVMFFMRWLVASTSIESLRDVTSETITAWREELTTWKISVSTLELRYAAVKTFCRLMSEAGVVDDVAAAVAYPQREERAIDERPVLSESEVADAVESIDESSPMALRDRAILEVLAVTGIRNSELRALTMEDVDLEDFTLLVRCGKGRKIRLVPLGSAASSLARYIENARPHFVDATSGDALFLSREHGSLSREALVAIVRKRAGVAPHRLRHSCATNMLRRGAQREKIQAVLGHSSFDTTKGYVH